MAKAGRATAWADTHLTGSGEPVLTARLVQAEQIEESIATEFAEKLSDALSETSIKVNIGTIAI